MYCVKLFNPKLHLVCGTKKVKFKLSRYRPCVAQRVGRGIALLFHDRGTRRGWVVSSTPRPHFTPWKDPVAILQETGWAPGPVWTGGKYRPHWDSIPDHPARSSVTIPTELPGPQSVAVGPEYSIPNIIFGHHSVPFSTSRVIFLNCTLMLSTHIFSVFHLVASQYFMCITCLTHRCLIWRALQQ